MIHGSVMCRARNWASMILAIQYIKWFYDLPPALTKLGRDHLPSRVLALATAPAAVFNSSWAPCNSRCAHLSPWHRAPPPAPGKCMKGRLPPHAQSAPCALAHFSLGNQRGCKISSEQMFRQAGSSAEKAPSSFPAASFLRSRLSPARSRLPGLPARPDDLIPGMFAITL